MRIEQQIRLLVLLSLFSIGMCVPAVCVANDSGNEKTSFSEVEECELKEDLENAEAGTALNRVHACDFFPSTCLDCLLGQFILEPEQTCLRSDCSRAPPV